MKKIRFGLPVLALVLAVSLSAFTKAKQSYSDTVWFKLNPVTGQAMNSTSGGIQSDSDPFDCHPSGDPCAASLLISSQVVDNHDGTYGIATGVDITTDYQGREYEPE